MIWLAYIVVGKLLIYLIMRFPLIQKVKTEFFRELFGCDLCLGVWVYLALGFLFECDILDVVGISHVVFVSEFITACVVSFVVHMFSLGWKAQFEVVEIE